MIDKAIKHFESLQKRYTTQHNGKMCEYVAIALDAMKKQLNTEEWIDCEYISEAYGNTYACPHCNKLVIGRENYCPRCGKNLLQKDKENANVKS